jgi:hypothetical protein
VPSARTGCLALTASAVDSSVKMVKRMLASSEMDRAAGRPADAPPKGKRCAGGLRA